MGQVSYRGFSYMCKTLVWKEGREIKKRKGEREDRGRKKEIWSIYGKILLYDLVGWQYMTFYYLFSKFTVCLK